MPCACISYNQPQDWQTEPEVILTPPEGLIARETVCVDACIVPLVQELWKQSIPTFGSCCGHGDESRRSIIVDRADKHKAKQVALSMKDGAHILAWELVEEV